MSIKIKNVNLIKIVLDIIMSVLLVLMFNKNVISLDFHEIGGLIVCLFFLIHTLLNRKWVAAVSKKIFSKALTPKLRLCYIIDVLLLITMTLILVSGIFISKILFTGIAFPGGNWKTLHYAASAMSLVLVGIHVGLHWGFVMGMFKKHVKIPAIIAKPLSIVLVIAVLLFGSYSMYTSSFSSWLTGPFTTNQMEGRPQRPTNADFQTDDSTTNTASSTSTSSDNNSQVADNIEQDQPNQDQKQNGTRPTKPNGGKSFVKGERPSGDGLPSQEGGIPQDGQGFPGGGGRDEHGGSSNVLSIILTFTSIMGVFATITYYCEKLLKRRKNLFFKRNS